MLSSSGHQLLLKYQTSVELQHQRSQHRTFASFLYCVITFCCLVNSEQSAMEEKGPKELMSKRALKPRATDQRNYPSDGHDLMEDDTILEAAATVTATTSNLIHEFILALNQKREMENARRLAEEKNIKAKLEQWRLQEEQRRQQEEEKRRTEDTRQDKKTTRLLNLLLDKEDKAMQQQLTLADKNRIKTPLLQWSDSDTPYNFFRVFE